MSIYEVGTIFEVALDEIVRIPYLGSILGFVAHCFLVFSFVKIIRELWG